MFNSILIGILSFGLIWTAGFYEADVRVSGGLVPCDVTGTVSKSCNDYLPGCPQQVLKCHVGTGDLTLLCDTGGGNVRCNRFLQWPPCLGENEDLTDSECEVVPVPDN